ncbi:hypothetical protein [Flavobacterium sp.]|uniref:hypothetical protein n=1 Tax=Flavobacterium sp. TaxID=239 RepID=UPI003751E4DA
MKKIIALLIITTFLACCNKDDNPEPAPPPISQLPPATQTGANTFGCLLDGEVFKPGITNNSYNCFYQLVSGEYYFRVSANNKKNNVLKAISVGTEQLSISQGQTLNLFERSNGNCYGEFFNGNDLTGVIENYNTSILYTGELKITKLDFTNNIVSGTFWYDVKDNQNVVHQIREGRFDMRFTQ